jgi:hypothetical protein
MAPPPSTKDDLTNVTFNWPLSNTAVHERSHQDPTVKHLTNMLGSLAESHYRISLLRGLMLNDPAAKMRWVESQSWPLLKTDTVANMSEADWDSGVSRLLQEEYWAASGLWWRFEKHAIGLKDLLRRNKEKIDLTPGFPEDLKKELGLG